MRTLVIGVDCATQANKTGLARATWDSVRLRLEEVFAGSEQSPPADTIAAWVDDGVSVLIALDAPLAGRALSVQPWSLIMQGVPSWKALTGFFTASPMTWCEIGWAKGRLRSVRTLSPAPRMCHEI